ncbi:MAG TPA: hypothetical protein VF868_05005 [Bacteroidia bacterium]|jgi:hypothetical protein
MKTSDLNSANLHLKQQSQLINAWPQKAMYSKQQTNVSALRSVFTVLFEKHALWFEESRFAMMTLMITLQSCIGSIACMYIFQSGAPDIQFVLCAAISMGTNAMFISQAPAKICLASFYLSLIVNMILILMNC